MVDAWICFPGACAPSRVSEHAHVPVYRVSEQTLKGKLGRYVTFVRRCSVGLARLPDDVAVA